MVEYKYPLLFSPLRIKNTVLKNRIFTAPSQYRHLPQGNDPNLETIRYYSRMAQGGAAMITIGETSVDQEYGYTHDTQFNLFSNRSLGQLTRVTRGIHMYGAHASIELCHGGKWALPRLIGGKNPLGPSALRFMSFDTGKEVIIDEMTEDQMFEITEKFANAAANVKRAGFDVALIHMGHGWGLAQFLSPLENFRKDKYGGSLENRARFPLMVLDAVRKAVGPDFVIDMRISGSERVPGGFDIDECIEFVKMVEDKIDAVQVSAGTRSFQKETRTIMHPSNYLPEGCNAYLAAAVKKSGVKIPVFTVGGFSDPELMERILQEGEADGFYLARGLLADPDLPKKAKAGRREEIIPCLRCGQCQDMGNLGRGGTGELTCTVNPLKGVDEILMQVPPSDEKRKVVVVGGGPAGMEAACVAAERGHSVVLFEASDTLGGLLNFAQTVPFKSEVWDFRNYLINRVKKNGIDVRLNTRADAATVEAEHPDAVIAAIGAEFVIPPIPGIDGANVLDPVQAHMPDAKIGHNVVIIGGGQVGCETGLHLAQLGHNVHVLEARESLATQDAGYNAGIALANELERVSDHFTSHVKVKCTQVTETGVWYEDNGQETFIEADTVIVCTGMKARFDEAESFRPLAYTFATAGDCIVPKNIRVAMHTALWAACSV